MQKQLINPWDWQKDMGYSQAVEVSNVTSTLYVSGQTAMDADGVPSNEDMPTQLKKAIANLQHVITEAGYEVSNIARLTVYATSSDAFMPEMGTLMGWLAENGAQPAVTYLEVVRLFGPLTVELEATVVR